MVSPALLGMLGVGLANTGANFYFGNKNYKMQKKLGKAQHRFALNQAQRGLDQTLDDNRRGRHRLLESLSDRGLFDSSVKENDLAYFDRSAGRQEQGAREGLSLAGKGMSAFKKQLRQQRMQNYLNLGTGLANAGLGAWLYSGMAPQVPADIYARNASMQGMQGIASGMGNFF